MKQIGDSIRLRELQRGLAIELAGRHTIPKSTVTHPKGVIVPGDPFLD